MKTRLALLFALPVGAASWTAFLVRPVWAEGLFPDGPPQPPKEIPKAPPDAAPRKDPEKPEKGEEEQAPPPEDILTIGAGTRMGEPSAAMTARTRSGVQITGIKGFGGMGTPKVTVMFNVKRWVAKGKWELRSFDTQLGSQIGRGEVPVSGYGMLDFRTPWVLRKVGKEARTTVRIRQDIQMGPAGPVIGPDGKPVRIPVEISETKDVEVAYVEHLWAKKDGKPVVGKIDNAKGAAVSLPEVPEEERPPDPPPPQEP